MIQPKLPAIFRPLVPPAAHLTKHDCCSDCNVPAVLAGNGDLKVCPQCYSLLWHHDWSVEERQRRREAAAAAKAADAARQQAREAKRQERMTKNEFTMKRGEFEK
jgi:hypothetical protein